MQVINEFKLFTLLFIFSVKIEFYIFHLFLRKKEMEPQKFKFHVKDFSSLQTVLLRFFTAPSITVTTQQNS